MDSSLDFTSTSSNDITTASSTDLSFSDVNRLSSSSNESIYSAEEQIIRQRGSRLSKKKALQELCQTDNQQLQQQHIHLISSTQEFLRFKQTCMNSPDSKGKHSPSSKAVSHCKQNLNYFSTGRRKSLLRTPVKRRLRKNAHILPKLRKSDNRRGG